MGEYLCKPVPIYLDPLTFEKEKPLIGIQNLPQLRLRQLRFAQN